MKWTSQVVVLWLSALSSVATAFVVRLPTSTTTSVSTLRPTRLPMVSGETIDAEVDYFYEDEDPDDPSQMRVRDIKAELDLIKVRYDDCFEKRQLEDRLREARDNPSKFLHQAHGGQQHEHSPADGPVGMKSVETSFVGLKQNEIGTTRSKTQTIFGTVDGVIEVEGQSSPASSSSNAQRKVMNLDENDNRPPSWTQESTLFQEQSHQTQRSRGAGGQSLEGFLETEEEQEPIWSSNYYQDKSGPQQTFFDPPSSAPDTSSSSNPRRRVQVEPAGNNRFDSSQHPSQGGPRWSQFEGVKVEQASRTTKDRFDGNHPQNGSSRWSSWEGVRVEAPGDNEVHFGPSTSNSYNRQLHVEKPKERHRNSPTNKQTTNEGTSMWQGVRVEQAGPSNTDDPFRSTRKQRPSYQNQEQGPNTNRNNNNNNHQEELNLEPDPVDGRKKKYKRASAREKKLYTGQRDFRYDQQAASTTFFNGIQVEQVPTEDDIKTTSYKREEQGGFEKDFRHDPQRADHHAMFRGIQVECPPGQVPPDAVRTSPPTPQQQQQQQSRARTTSFNGVKKNNNQDNNKSVQEEVYKRQNNNNNKGSAAHIPDDPFAQPTLEHPHPTPRTTSFGGVGPEPSVNGQQQHRAAAGYDGLWEKTVGGSSSGQDDEEEEEDNNGNLAGSMDIDGRL